MDSKDRDESPQEVLEENIIIVGGGIGGLACALALHRVGLKSLVLEQAKTLRAGGSAITLFDNAFRVLDVLGVGDQLRDMFINLAEWEVLDVRGKSIAKVVIAECEGGPHDLRAVERKCLLEVLAGALPEGAIRFNSRVTGLKTSETCPTGATQVQLQDGTTYSAKALQCGLQSHIWLDIVVFKDWQSFLMVTNLLPKHNISWAKRDVCHPMMPNMGQGGAMAMEDAIVFTQHLHGALGLVVGEQEPKSNSEKSSNEKSSKEGDH